jgi:hypothetical protein
MDYVYARVVQRAAEIVGGVEQLAKVLGASPLRVSAWAAGTSKPPKDVFLRAVDIVMAHDAPKGPGSTMNLRRPA